MATTFIPSIARPATAPPLLPVHTYNIHHDRREVRLPLNSMPPLPGGSYERLPQVEPSNHVDEESSPESETTLTPASTEDQEHTQEEAPSRRFVSPKWSRFFATLPHLSYSRPTTGNSPNEDKEIQEERFRYEKLEDFEKGLPRLAALLDSNESFSIFRRYGATAARVLLHREIELDLLIRKLHKLDREDAAPGGLTYRLQTVKHDETWDATQKILIDEIDKQLMEYYERLLKYMDVVAIGRPSERDQTSVYNWINNNRQLNTGEDTFILYVEDLISAKKKMEVNSQKGNRLEDLLDSWSRNWTGAFLKRYLRAKNGKNKTDDAYIDHYSAESLATLARVVIVFLAVNFLLIPVFLLFLVQMTRASMALVVLAFVLAFAIVLAGPVQARAQEVLIGTSAYGAFLVTFLGNMNSGYPLATGSQ